LPAAPKISNFESSGDLLRDRVDFHDELLALLGMEAKQSVSASAPLAVALMIPLVIESAEMRFGRCNRIVRLVLGQLGSRRLFVDFSRCSHRADFSLLVTFLFSSCGMA